MGLGLGLVGAAVAAGMLAAPASAEGVGEVGDRPALGAVHGPRFAASVQRLRGCRDGGDLLVTVERRGSVTTVIARRGGVACFRLPFSDGPGGVPATVRIYGTVDAQGGAGPLAVVASQATSGEAGDGWRELRSETHLVLVGPGGELLLDRGVATSAFAGDDGSGGEVTLVPAWWDGEKLLVWSSDSRWSEGERRCTGSLLGVKRRGPIEVAEGVPCSLSGAADVDGDGKLELVGRSESDAPWRAAVNEDGDLLEAPPPGDGPVPEFAPVGDLGVLRSVEAAGAGFDWTGDGTADETFLGTGEDGASWLAVRAEGEVTFAWPAGLAGIPLHQAPRALSLVGRGPEVLVRSAAGFVVRSVPGGEVRWEGRREDGVLDAWALPGGGNSSVGGR